MLRLIIYAVILIPFFLLCELLRLILWPFQKKWPDKTEKISFSVTAATARLLLFLGGVRIIWKGRENLPRKGVYLYISNHRSIFDILIFLAWFRQPSGFIAKKELKNIPIFSDWLTHLHVLYLDRSNVREGMKTILEGVQLMKAGLSMTICPEGTRNKSADQRSLLEFHAASFKLAEKAGCPIIPIALANTENIFENHKPFIHATKVYLTIGQPVDPKTLEPEQKKFIGKYVQELIQSMLDEMPF